MKGRGMPKAIGSVTCHECGERVRGYAPSVAPCNGLAAYGHSYRKSDKRCPGSHRIGAAPQYDDARDPVTGARLPPT